MTYVTVTNVYKTPVPVGGKMLYPGDSRQVPAWIAEAARQYSPDLQIDGDILPTAPAPEPAADPVATEDVEDAAPKKRGRRK